MPARPLGRTTVSFRSFSVGLSDQLRSVRVFIVVTIRLEALKLPFRGRGLDFFLPLLGSDGGPLLLNHHWVILPRQPALRWSSSLRSSSVALQAPKCIAGSVKTDYLSVGIRVGNRRVGITADQARSPR
jgi:hypothetical protein